jgi:hypothetical protein
VAAAEALRDVRGYAAAGRLRFTRHARERMRERGATASDVRHALSSATRCDEATEAGRWKVRGQDLDGDELVMVVVLEGDVVVVTVF